MQIINDHMDRVDDTLIIADTDEDPVIVRFTQPPRLLHLRSSIAHMVRGRIWAIARRRAPQCCIHGEPGWGVAVHGPDMSAYGCYSPCLSLFATAEGSQVPPLLAEFLVEPMHQERCGLDLPDEDLVYPVFHGIEIQDMRDIWDLDDPTDVLTVAMLDGLYGADRDRVPGDHVLATIAINDQGHGVMRRWVSDDRRAMLLWIASMTERSEAWGVAVGIGNGAVSFGWRTRCDIGIAVWDHGRQVSACPFSDLPIYAARYLIDNADRRDMDVLRGR